MFPFSKGLIEHMETIEWVPHLSEEDRAKKTARWEMAVERSLDWDDMETPEEVRHVRKYSDRLLSVDTANDSPLHKLRLLD